MHYFESKAMWEEVIVRSGEVESLREGTWVGESRLRRRRSEFVRDSVIRVPLVVPSYMLSESTRQGYGGLMSPMMMSSRKLKRG